MACFSVKYTASAIYTAPAGVCELWVSVFELCLDCVCMCCGCVGVWFAGSCHVAPPYTITCTVSCETANKPIVAKHN